MRLLRFPQPFDHSDFLFELKYDGLRALAIIEDGDCRLLSRNGYLFSAWPDLAAEIARALHRADAVLDGEIVCLDDKGRSDFHGLTSERSEPVFVAFDLLQWAGADLRGRRLADRKRYLRSRVRSGSPRVRIAELVHARGVELFRLACDYDLEGIVAKWMHGTYQCGPQTSWLEINNPRYSQLDGRAELFEKRGTLDRRRASVPPAELRLG